MKPDERSPEIARAFGIASSNELWPMIRREAQTAVAIDPVFAGSISAAILDR